MKKKRAYEAPSVKRLTVKPRENVLTSCKQPENCTIGGLALGSFGC